MERQQRVIGFGLISGVAQLALGGFLLFLLAAGVFQDADQWTTYSQQMVVHIILITFGGTVGILASSVALYQPRSIPLGKAWTSATGMLVAAVVTTVSIPLGWNYWLEFASNVWFFVVVISSVIYVAVYLALTTVLLWTRQKI